MGTDGTNRSHARCYPYPIPQPVNVGHTTGVCVPYPSRTVVRVLLRPPITDQWSAVRPELRLFVLKCEKTRESNHLQISLQRQHFLLSYLKTLSVGPARIWTRNLPLGTRRFPNWTYLAWRFAQGWKLKILIPCWKSQYFYSFRYRLVLCVNKNINAWKYIQTIRQHSMSTSPILLKSLQPLFNCLFWYILPWESNKPLRHFQMGNFLINSLTPNRHQHQFIPNIMSINCEEKWLWELWLI